jgi:hypothetical protein
MESISIQQTGYGHWKISTQFRNTVISCITTDSVSIDNYRSDLCDREKGAFGQTRKQAATSLYNEIVRANKNQ